MGVAMASTLPSRAPTAAGDAFNPIDSQINGAMSSSVGWLYCTTWMFLRVTAYGLITEAAPMDLCAYSSILLLVSWGKIHARGENSTSGVGQKDGKRRQVTIERDEVTT